MKVRSGKVVQAPRRRWLIRLGATDTRRGEPHASFDGAWSSRHQPTAARGWVSAHTVADPWALPTAAGWEGLEHAEWARQHVYHLRATQAWSTRP